MSLSLGELKKYKESLYSAKSRELADFEKNFLFVSSALLAFSITFIRDIVGGGVTSCNWSLFTSWILLGASLACLIISFLRSAKLSDNLWDYADAQLRRSELVGQSDGAIFSSDFESVVRNEITRRHSSAKKILSRWRNGAALFFILGIIALGIFVGMNFQSTEEKSSNPVVVVDKKNRTISVDGVVFSFTDSLINTQISVDTNNKSDTIVKDSTRHGKN